MSTIYATRQGYLYQDKFALLSFLTHFLAKDLLELYVDFPFDDPNQRSMDLRFILRDGEGKIEKICGVKTGDRFKNDTGTSDDSSQIRDAFKELNVYDSIARPADTTLIMSLVINPPFRDKISDCWRHLHKINGKHNYADEVITSADWLHIYLSMSEFRDGRSMFGFLKKIKIEDSYSDLLDSEGEEMSPLDYMIKGKVEELEKIFGVDSKNHELPTELLISKLLYICQKNAGNGRDIVDLFKKAVLDFFARRGIVNRNDNTDYEKALEEMERKYTIWQSRDLVVVVERSVPTVGAMTEGGDTNA